MPTRDHAPIGAPCWADLWTSDVERARAFYSELFGWVAADPDPQYGGYFLFKRDGVDVAGAMGPMGEMEPSNTWKPYFATPDLNQAVQWAEEMHAAVVAPPMPVGDLGLQAVLEDPSGAALGFWQAKSFAGFTVLDEPGSPSWFELFTRDFAKAVAFYHEVLQIDTVPMSDTDEFRYTTLNEGDHQLAGIMDASGFLPEGVADHWSIYWEVASVDDTAAAVTRLGGSLVDGPQDTPYGRMATATDPMGAPFKLPDGTGGLSTHRVGFGVGPETLTTRARFAPAV